MRMTAVALILVCLASPSAPAQEAKAKPRPEPAKVQVKKLVEDKDAAIGQLAIDVRAYMLAELRFARAACGLSKDEYKALGKDALGQCDRLAKDLLPAYLTRAKPDPKAPPPTAAIEDALATAVKSHATTAQCARYADEIKKRRDDRRESAIEIILLTMDRRLLFSARQRDSIRRELVDHWSPGWYDALILRNPLESEWMVMIPDDIVTPLLGPTQQQIWNQRASLVVDPFSPLDVARKTRQITGPDLDLEPNPPAQAKEARP